MLKTNLFIARTPLQLFNCIEAKKRFHSDDENILFYQYQREIDKKQMEGLIEIDGWEEIIPYQLSSVKKIFFPFFLDGIISKYKHRVNSCYYGTYNSIIAALINLISPKELVLVDDGTRTLVRAKLLESKTIEKRNFFKRIRDKILSTDRQFLYKSTFFSLYPLEEYKIENKIILNDYRMFKESLSSLPMKEMVYFIGTPLGEHVLKNKLMYEAYIKKVIAYYANKKFIYILHRYEEIDEIKKISKKYNFQYIKFDTILESAIFNEGFIPKEFATFTSSAIETLPILYPTSNYKSFYIESKDILEKKQDIMERIYKNYQAKGYEVIHL